MAAIRRIHVPLLSPESIKPHLGAEHHWKEGRSAKLLIDQWWAANDLPASIKGLLNQASEWRNAELVDAFAERKTSLDDGRPSHPQSDLIAIVGIENRLVILAIEAKVDEGFDKTIEQWLADDSAGKKRRLDGLCELLGLNPTSVSTLRYQLLHRVVASALEAKRYRAHQAAMVIQSWCPKRSGHEDFLKFLAKLGIPYEGVGHLSSPLIVSGIPVRMGWLAEAD